MIRAFLFALALLPGAASAQAPQCNDYWSYTEPNCVTPQSDGRQQDQIELKQKFDTDE